MAECGMASIINVAGLTSEDPQLVELAIIDGATRLQRIWHISLPAIIPTIVIVFLLNVSNITTTDFQKAFAMQNDHKNTILYTIIGTIISVMVTIMAAYPLSRKDFYGRKFFSIINFCNNRLF